ncbi:MAG: extracellular solute-binding protein, partial [Mesorhizobium sp.]
MAFDLKSINRKTVQAGLAAFALALSSTVAVAADKLQYFTWSGYELPDFNKSFLAAHPDGVEASMFGDDDDAFTKVKAGFRPDVAHPCYDKVARWNKEGLLQPIDTKRIKNWDSIFPVFKNLPDLQAGDGKVWMVPWDWGNTSILYRTDLVKNPEPSWNLLWDKQYAGRMATIDAVHDTPVVAALLAGVNPFDMTPEQMEKVAEKLREQRPLLSNYTTDMTSVEQALASGQLVAAMTWNASATSLKKQGVPVEFMKPR